MRISIGSAGAVLFSFIRATVAGGRGASCFGYPGAACATCPSRAAAMRAKTGRCDHLSMEIIGGFQLLDGMGSYGVSNGPRLPFAGNCGNKWLASSPGELSERGAAKGKLPPRLAGQAWTVLASVSPALAARCRAG